MIDFLDNSIYLGIFLNLMAFQVGLYFKKRFNNALANPLLISSILVILVIFLLDIDFETYAVGANYISYFLTPATVCFGVILYKRIELLKKFPSAIMVAIGSGVLTAMCCVFFMSYFFGLSQVQYISLLPKSITTAVGIGIAEKMGGIESITIIAITITGIFGNMMAETFCKWFKIDEPIAKGLAIGSSSHAIGTTKAIEMGEIEGAMSSLAIVVSALMTVLGISIFANFI